jgi:hypothetical protein
MGMSQCAICNEYEYLNEYLIENPDRLVDVCKDCVSSLIQAKIDKK